MSKCPKCEKKTKYETLSAGPHIIAKSWTCKDCGVVKTQYVVDGTVVRTWVIK